MARAKCLYHDLLCMPKNHRGIFWLRLYQLRGGRFQALVTEVPGNNGMAVGNDASMIHRAIARKFAIDPKTLDMIAIWPKLRNFGAQRLERASYSLKTNPGWKQISRAQVEATVGTLPPLPDHAELFSRVLACGGRVRETYRDVFEAIPVEELPPPHGPYQCEHIDRFEKMLGRLLSFASTHWTTYPVPFQKLLMQPKYWQMPESGDVMRLPPQ
jgi:hypothetical protein